MKLECHFKSIDWSDSLVAYTEDRFSKIKKYEVKPVLVHVTFSTERHRRTVEVNVQGLGLHYKAFAQTGDYYESVDRALQKIIGQMSKKKNKVQRHKNYRKSHQGRMERMTARFEPYLKAS